MYRHCAGNFASFPLLQSVPPSYFTYEKTERKNSEESCPKHTANREEFEQWPSSDEPQSSGCTSPQSSSLWSREKGGFSSGIHKYSSPSGKLQKACSLFKLMRHVFLQSKNWGTSWVWSATRIHFFLDGPLLSNLISIGQRTCCFGSRSQELCLDTQTCIPDQCTCGYPTRMKSKSQLSALEFFQQTLGNKLRGLECSDCLALFMWSLEEEACFLFGQFPDLSVCNIYSSL